MKLIFHAVQTLARTVQRVRMPSITQVTPVRAPSSTRAQNARTSNHANPLRAKTTVSVRFKRTVLKPIRSINARVQPDTQVPIAKNQNRVKITLAKDGRITRIQPKNSWVTRTTKTVSKETPGSQFQEVLVHRPSVGQQ